MKDDLFVLAAQIMQHYGAEAQKDILRRGILAEDKPAYTYDMISEMADVQIMLWQFESVMSKHSRQCYEDEICRKLRRQIERIESENP